MKAYIQGNSDDLLHVDFEGGFGYEFNLYLNPREWAVVHFKDGTEVQVEYDGCWKMSQLEIGDALYVLDFEAISDESSDYSDIVTLHDASDVDYVVHMHVRGTVKKYLDKQEARYGAWPKLFEL